jgi:hypothetical protein
VKQRNSVAHVENAEADFSNDHVSHIFMVEDNTSTSNDPDLILLDKGAQVSVFMNDSLLVNITAVDKPVLISGFIHFHQRQQNGDSSRTARHQQNDLTISQAQHFVFC